jgi:hypothetical protein
MAVSISGISTLGVTLSYGVETTAGTKPATFVQLPRVNSISGIELDTETIDASALEDYQERTIAGRQSTGGEWSVTFNLTNETIPLIEAMMEAASEALSENKRTWFQVAAPNLTKAFFVVGQPGTKVPMPDFGQNELLTGDISITIDEYKGLDTKVTPTEA